MTALSNVLSCIPENIPEDMRALPWWVTWKAVDTVTKTGEAYINKVPVNPRTGRNARNNDPSTWGTFDQAVTHMEKAKMVAGIGFEFMRKGNIVGIDLDKCRNPETGVLDEWAQKIVDDFNTYTELSPSGKGLHLFVRGDHPKIDKKIKAKRNDGKEQIEIFVDVGCYMTVTGHRVPGTPATIEPRKEALDALYATLKTEKAAEVTDAISHEDEDSPRGAKPETVKEALSFIKADDRDTWIKIGMALRNWNEQDGLIMWKEWSATCPEKYVEGECEDKWKGFKTNREDKVTLGTVFALARKGGWTRKPTVFLPGGDPIVRVSETSVRLGRLLGERELFFMRGSALMRMMLDEKDRPYLYPVIPAQMVTEFERVANLAMRYTEIDPDSKEKVIDPETGKPKIIVVPYNCNEQTAKLIINSQLFRDAMPAVKIVSCCPVITEVTGKLVEVNTYHWESGVLAYGKPVKQVGLGDAVEMLHDLLADFIFATPSDKARALAAMISPALVFGGLLRGRAPIDLGEADDSQAGKGYRNKITAAIYNTEPVPVTQKSGGVGSLEESFNSALIKGHCFIALDNVRGKIDSPKIESFMTENTYMARVAYSPDVEIDPRRVVVQFTSNKADMTTDLANRSSCVRILKQKADYTFRSFPEGDLLDHVVANQPWYLGAVFAVIRTWYERGRPVSPTAGHDFRAWARALDWITRNILNAGPLLHGHRETQHRITNPAMTWFRDLTLAVKRQGRLEELLTTHDLAEILFEDGTVELPGLTDGEDLSEDDNRKKCLQAMGRKLSSVFRVGDKITIDNMESERIVEAWEGDETKSRKYYRFFPAVENPSRYDSPDHRGEDLPSWVTEQSELPLEGVQVK